VPSEVEERPPPGPPSAAAVAVALAKARAVAPTAAGAVVLAADTIVVVDDTVLGKPLTATEAVRMLRALRARVHDVITGVAVVAGGRELTAAVRTRVTMRDYTDAEIDRYVATGEPLDKAGAYAVQEAGRRLVARVDGCLTNVIGLPVTTVRELLRRVGVSVLEPE
jgi:septum formation protein